jgi:hypothetical protein
MTIFECEFTTVGLLSSGEEERVGEELMII